MILRRAGLGLLVGAVLMAPSGASAGPALVFEPYNGTVFYAEDPDAQWFPASLTKLMTAYVAFQALKAGTVTSDTKLICSKEATEQAPSKLWLKVGESITLDVALKVLIVESANDVAVMIAEGVAGSEGAFVQRMNEAAQHLGMRRTNFANVNGLPDDRQVTTARDLAKLNGARHAVLPDRIETGTFLTAAAAAGGEVTLKGARAGTLRRPSTFRSNHSVVSTRANAALRPDPAPTISASEIGASPRGCVPGRR